MKLKKINEGLVLLRFVAMLGIVMIHVINQGGIINNYGINKPDYFILNIIWTLAIISVDVFAIITGYLYCEKEKVNYKSIIKLLFIMFFYSSLITIIFYIFNFFNIRNNGFINIIVSIFPFLKGRYWYIVCYFLLFCIIPFLNIFIKNISKKEFVRLLIILFILLCVISTFGLRDYFKIENGYSPFWLMYCYLIGAYIKKYISKFNFKKILLYLLLFIIIASFLNYLCKFITFNIFGKFIKEFLFLDYNSPFIVIAAFLIVLIFSNLNIICNRFINFLSASSFGVYIIHGHILVFDYILTNRFYFLCNYNVFITILGVFIFSFVIYFICSVLDYFREIIFKYLKVNNIIDKVGLFIDSYMFEK